jgi:hypothetical protein
VRYSEEIAREAVRRFLARRLRELFDVKFRIAAVAAIGTLCWLLWTGNRSWLVGAVATLLVLVPVALLAVYAAHWRNTVVRIRQMQVPMARCMLSDTELTIASELGSATIPWTLILEIWQFQRVWLLLISPSYFVTLPTDGIPAAALEFMRTKVTRRNSSARGAIP